MMAQQQAELENLRRDKEIQSGMDAFFGVLWERGLVRYDMNTGWNAVDDPKEQEALRQQK